MICAVCKQPRLPHQCAHDAELAVCFMHDLSPYVLLGELKAAPKPPVELTVLDGGKP